MFVFVDLETTGLDDGLCEIIEVGLAVVSPDLEKVSARSWLVKPAQCSVDVEARIMHEESGLWREVVEHGLLREYVEKEALSFLKAQGVAPGERPMTGNSVHFDRRFLFRHMRALHDFFHYRNIDVSTVRQLMQLWCEYENKKKKPAHRALADIENSIEELRYFYQLVHRRAS